MNYFEDARNFIRLCDEGTSVMYDVDADGVTAGAIMSHILKNNGVNHTVIPDNHFIPYLCDATRDIYNSLVGTKRLIGVDIPLDQGYEHLKKLADQGTKVLLIDHHQPKKNLNEVGMIHVNPHFLGTSMKPVQYCGSKLTFDVCDSLTDEDMSWLAGAGIIGDFAGEAWQPFLDGVYRNNPTLRATNRYYWESDLGDIASLINAGLNHSNSEGGRIAHQACMQAKRPEDILEGRYSSSILKDFKREVDVEVKRLAERWRQDARMISEKDNLVVYDLKSSMFPMPEVTNRISHEVPDHTFIVMKDEKDMTYLTLRRIDEKVNCGKLAASATSGLENSGGGGHVIAAGGFIMKKDKEKFLQNVNRYLSIS